VGWRNIKILCQAYKFTDESLASEKRNYYNTSANKVTVGNEINLMDFAISIGTLSFSRITQDKDSGGLIYEVGDVSLELSGRKMDRFLMNYFLFNSSSLELDFRKYRIRILYDNEEIWTGFVMTGDVSEKFNNTKTTEVINVRVLSSEKELIEYMTSIKMLAPADIFQIPATAIRLPWWYDSRTEDNHTDTCSSTYFWYIIQKTLGINVNSGNLYNWMIANIPQMFKSDGTSPWFIRSGYKRFWEQNWTFKEYFFKVCNALGWSWKLKNDAFYIQNRNEFNYPVKTLYAEDLQELSIGYELNKTINHIVIPDGQLSSMLYHTGLDSDMGIRFKLISNSAKVNNHTNFFEYFTGKSGIAEECYYNLWVSDYFRNTIKNNEDNDNWNYVERWIYEQQWGHIGTEAFSILKENTLIIDAGSQPTTKTMCQVDNTYNKPAETREGYDKAILFSGNCGASLFQYGADAGICALDYHDYCKTNTFRNNFLSLITGNGNRVIDYDTKGVILSPEFIIKPLNNKYPAIHNMEYAIDKLEVDLVSENSRMILIRKVV
jgi:hypothetical protein